MKVREEIDALTTMGLDSLRFLAVPRVIAAVAMTPLLAVFANLFGLIGGAVVMLSLGFTLTTYVNQILLSIDVGDLLGGLFKSVVFGMIVAAIGCLRGLQTKTARVRWESRPRAPWSVGSCSLRSSMASSPSSITISASETRAAMSQDQRPIIRVEHFTAAYERAVIIDDVSLK